MILAGFFGFLLGRKVAERKWIILGLIILPFLLSLFSCFAFFRSSSGLDVVYTALPLSYPMHLELRRMPIEIYPPMYVVRMFFFLEVYRFEMQSESLYALTINFFPVFYVLNLIATAAGSWIARLKRKTF